MQQSEQENARGETFPTYEMRVKTMYINCTPFQKDISVLSLKPLDFLYLQTCIFAPLPTSIASLALYKLLTYQVLSTSLKSLLCSSYH